MNIILRSACPVNRSHVSRTNKLHSLSHKYPNDPRGLTHVKQNGEHGLTSPQIVFIKGRRFLFVGGMFASNFLNDDEMAIPAALIMRWGNPLYRTEQKWPTHRPRIYSADKITLLEPPMGVNKVARVVYLEFTAPSLLLAVS